MEAVTFGFRSAEVHSSKLVTFHYRLIFDPGRAYRDASINHVEMRQVKEFEICESVAQAVRDCKAGSTIMVGGFGLSGIPENIIEYVGDQPEMKDYTIISTEAGEDDWGLGRLIQKGKIKKQYASYIGRCKVFEQAFLKGRMEVELTPQGSVRYSG